MMDKNRAPLGSRIPFGLNEYLQASLLPMEAKVCTLSVNAPGPRVQGKDVQLILCTGGSGVVIVNDRKLKLTRGSFICLGPFHNYCLIPAQGESLELKISRMDCSAFLYILACPYLPMKGLAVPQPPVEAHISQSDTRRVEGILDAMMELSQPGYYNEKLRFLYMMELVGLLMTMMDRPRDHKPDTEATDQ